MVIFLLFLYFAAANGFIVPQWIMDVTWVLTALSFTGRLIRFAENHSKKG